jgi:hypothetical protein
MAADSWGLAVTLLGGAATLGIFTFLWKENPIFRFFEHVFVGIAAGLGTVVVIKNSLWPMVLEPMLGLDIVVYPDGTLSKQYDPRLLLYILPMLFGLLYYFIYSSRNAWLAKLVIGFSLGASGGLAFKGFFNQMLPQLTSSFKPLLVFGREGLEVWRSLENTFFVLTLVIVIYYFFFSFKFSMRRAGAVSCSGRWLLMVCFGAFFGSTVMARLSLLVERLQFLLVDFSAALRSLWLA